MIAYPFEMATIVALNDQRLVGTAYGLYNMLAGLGIAAGNLLGGAAFDLANRIGIPQLPWLLLTLLGAASTLGIHLLGRANRLTQTTAETGHATAGQQPAPVAQPR